MSTDLDRITTQTTIDPTFQFLGYSNVNSDARLVSLSTIESAISSGSESVTTTQASPNITVLNKTYFCDCVNASLTMTLTTAANKAGRWIKFKRTDVTTNTLTLTPDGSETIDLQTAIILSGPNQPFVRIMSDGTNWKIVDA